MKFALQQAQAGRGGHPHLVGGVVAGLPPAMKKRKAFLRAAPRVTMVASSESGDDDGEDEDKDEDMQVKQEAPDVVMHDDDDDDEVPGKVTSLAGAPDAARMAWNGSPHSGGSKKRQRDAMRCAASSDGVRSPASTSASVASVASSSRSSNRIKLEPPAIAGPSSRSTSPPQLPLHRARSMPSRNTRSGWGRASEPTPFHVFLAQTRRRRGSNSMSAASSTTSSQHSTPRRSLSAHRLIMHT